MLRGAYCAVSLLIFSVLVVDRLCSNPFRRKVHEINWQRKQEQSLAGETLTQLEEEWVMLVGKNYEIEQALVDLEQELQISASGLSNALPVNGELKEV